MFEDLACRKERKMLFTHPFQLIGLVHSQESLDTSVWIALLSVIWWWFSMWKNSIWKLSSCLGLLSLSPRKHQWCGCLIVQALDGRSCLSLVRGSSWLLPTSVSLRRTDWRCHSGTRYSVAQSSSEGMMMSVSFLPAALALVK